MNDLLMKQIAIIQKELPIHYPKQVYLRKGDEYIDSYDPVAEIIVNKHSIDIVGINDYHYNHSFDEFDKIYIVPNGDEPVQLTAK